ncbi:MAG: prenyltransferase [Anaerolineae bacterium]|nr:prenyltransferase [Anaerolineae bacterium]
MPIGSRDIILPKTINVSWGFRTWIQSFRLKFLPQGVLPVFLGSIIAWYQTGKFDPGLFTLAVIGSACVQIGLTLLNDTLDYVYGTDKSTTSEKNPFSGGSGVLVDGLLHPNKTLTVVKLFYSVAAIIGGYLTFRVGIGIFWIALLGLFLSVCYSVKPLRLAYRGIGEFAMLIGYGPTIALGASYLQTGVFSAQAGLAGLVPGLLMWSMILVNEIPDYKEDLRANKLNLTVRFGPNVTRWLYIISLSGVYIFIVCGALGGLFPKWTLLGLASLPIAVRSFRVVLNHYLNPNAIFPANHAMVLTYTSTMVLFCLGFWLGKAL